MPRKTATRKRTTSTPRTRRRSKKDTKPVEEPQRIPPGTLGTVLTRETVAHTVLRAIEKMPLYAKSLLSAAEMCCQGKVRPITDSKFEVMDSTHLYTVDLTLGCNCRMSNLKGTQMCVHQHAAYLFHQNTKVWSEHRSNNNSEPPAVHRKPEAEVSFTLNVGGNKIRLRARGESFRDLRSLVSYMMKWKKHTR